MNAVRCDVLEAGMAIPVTRLCQILEVPRSTAYHQPKTERLHRPVDEDLARTIHAIIQDHPAYGLPPRLTLATKNHPLSSLFPVQSRRGTE